MGGAKRLLAANGCPEGWLWLHVGAEVGLGGCVQLLLELQFLEAAMPTYVAQPTIDELLMHAHDIVIGAIQVMNLQALGYIPFYPYGHIVLYSPLERKCKSGIARLQKANHTNPGSWMPQHWKMALLQCQHSLQADLHHHRHYCISVRMMMEFVCR